MKKIALLCAVLSVMANIAIAHASKIPSIVNIIIAPYIIGALLVTGWSRQSILFTAGGTVFLFIALMTITMPIYNMIKQNKTVPSAMVLAFGVTIWTLSIYLGANLRYE